MGFEETAGMVSNTLNMDLDELMAALKRIAENCGDDPDYIEMRSTLPADWPI